jgi:hypothetical protein
MALFPKNRKKETVKSPLKYNKQTGVLTRGKTTYDPTTGEQVKKSLSVTMPWKKGSDKNRLYKSKEVSSVAGEEKKVLKSKEVKVDSKGNKFKTKVDGNITMTKTKRKGGNSKFSVTDAGTGKKYSAKNVIAANRRANKLKKS